MEIEFVKQSQMSQLRVPLIHFDHNEGKNPNIEKDLKGKNLIPKAEKILKNNFANSSFIANEHIIVDIPTAVFVSNSQEFEEQTDDLKDGSNRENEKTEWENDKSRDKQSINSSSLPASIKSEILMMLFLIFFMSNIVA